MSKTTKKTNTKITNTKKTTNIAKTTKTKKTIKTEKNINKGNKKINDNVCSLCNNEFDILKKIECKHNLCIECVLKSSVNYEDECPICKKNIKTTLSSIIKEFNNSAAWKIEYLMGHKIGDRIWFYQDNYNYLFSSKNNKIINEMYNCYLEYKIETENIDKIPLDDIIDDIDDVPDNIDDDLVVNKVRKTYYIPKRGRKTNAQKKEEEDNINKKKIDEDVDEDVDEEENPWNTIKFNFRSNGTDISYDYNTKNYKDELIYIIKEFVADFINNAIYPSERNGSINWKYMSYFNYSNKSDIEKYRIRGVCSIPFSDIDIDNYKCYTDDVELDRNGKKLGIIKNNTGDIVNNTGDTINNTGDTINTFCDF